MNLLFQMYACFGAVISLNGIATTSSRPRYMLREEFAALFDLSLTDEKLAAAIHAWQAKHLSKST